MGDVLQNAGVLASKQCRGAHGWLLQLREDVKFRFEIIIIIFLIHMKDGVQRTPSDP